MRLAHYPTAAPLMLAAAALLSACASAAESDPQGSTTSGPTCAPGADCTTGADGLPPDFVRLADVDATIPQEMRYAADHNFVGSPITGYDAASCWMTRQAADALTRAQAAAVAQGYTLKIYDCYRPQRAVDEFAAWAEDSNATTMQAEFYPRVSKPELFPAGYIAAKSGHSRGSTVDVTLVPLPGATSPAWTPGDPLVDCTAPVEQRFPDTSIDMGTGFDCFDPLANTANPEISATAAANRATLVTIMAEAGFTNLPEEWWHYTLAGEPYPGTFFDVPITR